MLDQVYILSTYEWCLFSYSGLEVDEIYVFRSEVDAIKYAENNGLYINDYPKDDNYCTIEQYSVIDVH